MLEIKMTDELRELLAPIMEMDNKELIVKKLKDNIEKHCQSNKLDYIIFTKSDFSGNLLGDIIIKGVGKGVQVMTDLELADMITGGLVDKAHLVPNFQMKIEEMVMVVAMVVKFGVYQEIERIGGFLFNYTLDKPHFIAKNQECKVEFLGNLIDVIRSELKERM